MSGTIGIMAGRRGATVIAAAAVFAIPVVAFAADCKQEHAVYVDRDGAYELRFTPLNSPSAAASNQFKVNALETSVVMEGYVMPSEDPVRAIGVLMFNCPEGDATGADLDACTVWQGAVYGMNAKGEMDNLQPEGAAAAEKLVLPGLGPAIRESSAWGEGKASVAPWDVMTFKECAT
ncbi:MULTISPECIES: hypothetical protein [Rhizobium]|uniref:hypothetical protein n=1 Tax=Rhizobium TaxID=379 RepID=UPI0007EC1A0B|nr:MULTISPECIES: hypothetical protein [Rhizobium]ANK93475.1 hypothetical protein AMK01_CH04082 [Rhizobium sp. N6212]ANK99521.1 hypothetical protein AMK00_CH04085 [Rhizobium sp. N621]ANL05651.1 hypothetical protein AMJ99_CH04163 [Rhizobium esperanzae]ANL11705.1 hypothetical protein AMJ98_CH04113 [Rhizobium sp. N1341]ANL23779.1 hypothetical protein AMJ96_CH04134 [Rhizobium sp. N113]